jgi:hypothetical protein
MRSETPGRLEPVERVAPKLARIETPKCREAGNKAPSGAESTAEQAQGGRAKAPRAKGKPRRGKRSREHRPTRALNRKREGTDARSEQSSGVVETAREQRAPRGAAADRVGKALEAKILRADVARNKATRPGRDQTAERVRNPESGRYRRGKPVQRLPGFKRRKEPNPMGDVAELFRCAKAQQAK